MVITQWLCAVPTIRCHGIKIMSFFLKTLFWGLIRLKVHVIWVRSSLSQKLTGFNVFFVIIWCPVLGKITEMFHFGHFSKVSFEGRPSNRVPVWQNKHLFFVPIFSGLTWKSSKVIVKSSGSYRSLWSHLKSIVKVFTVQKRSQSESHNT